MKVENDKLKEKLQETSNELKKVQEAMKEQRDGGHIGSAKGINLQTSRVRSGEHGELYQQIEIKVSAIENKLKGLSSDIESLSSSIDQALDEVL